MEIMRSELALNPAKVTKKSARNSISLVIRLSLLTLFAAYFFVPFLLMVITSLSTNHDLFGTSIQWIPHPIEWHFYMDSITSFPFFTYLWNTMQISLLNVLGTVISCSLVAYALSRITWPGRDVLFVIVLATMMIPYPVYMTPLFIMFKSFGWVGSFKPLIVPSFFATDGFSVFLLRQFFMTIPKELSSAAQIDGCNEFTTFLRIVLPLAKPALFVVCLFTFLNNWNDYLGPLIYLQDSSQYTLQIALYTFFSAHGAEWQKVMAVCTLITIPVVLIFLVGQRTFVQGITLGGVKE